MNALLVTLQSLGVTLGLAFGAIFIILVAITWYVRKQARGRVFAYFVETNNQVSTRLLNDKGGLIETNGPDGDPESYLVNSKKNLWTFWPPGVPMFLKVPIPSNFYVRDRAEPIDPYEQKSLVTASSLRYMLDEGMLKQTWKEARESVGIRAAMVSRGNLVIYILLLLAMLLSAISIWMTSSASSEVSELTRILTGG